MTYNQCVVRGAGLPQIASSGVTQATVSVDNTSTSILVAGTRSYLLIQNRGATSVYLRLDGGTATTASGIEILPGGSYEPPVVPQGLITGIRASATENVIVVTG